VLDPRVGTKFHVFSTVVAVGLLIGGSGRSWSQENIGDAKIVINAVEGNLPTGSQVPVAQGDNVFLNEAVHSGPDSKANLLLKDSTNVTVGPETIVKLDSFVYTGPKQPATIALNVAKGTMRFVTGDASKRAYTILTPTAAIGVRGTILRIEVTDGETKVINEEGVAIICHRPKDENVSVAELRKRHCSKEQRAKGLCGCQELLIPNTQATITQTQIAVTEAPVNAITQPIINESVGFAGGSFTAPVAAVGATGAAVIGGSFTATVAANALNKEPLSP
jgi:hypothetical protein